MFENQSCDVLIIGGGPTGVVAALSAARAGAKTILITDRPVLGGNSSSEIRVWTRGSTGGGNLFAEEMGIWGELKLKNLHKNPTGNVLYWDEILLDTVLSQPNLSLFFNTLALDVLLNKEGDRIASVTCRGLRTEKEFHITAKQFVDCTGDGYVAMKAGIPYRTGREGREVFGENLAQKQTDSFAQGCSILLQSKRTGKPAPYIAPSYVYGIKKIEQLIGRGGRIVVEDMGGSDCWWFEYGGQLDIIGDDQKIAIELRRIALGIWNYIKNSGRFSTEDSELEWIGSIPGRRTSRRMIGEETLTQQDVMEDSRRKDAVCYGGWFMDSHPSGGIKSDKEQCVQMPVHCYSIPLTCLFHAKIGNLLFAGRNISSSYMAFTSARIMNTCAMAGQAAGTAAALCAQKELTPMELWACKRDQLLLQLAEDDVLLAHPLKTLMFDGVTVYASSTKPPQNEESGKLLPLNRKSYVVYPCEGGAAVLQLEAKEAGQVTYRMEVSHLPCRRCEGNTETHTLKLTPGRNQWMLPAVQPETGGFVTLFLETAKDVSLVGGTGLPGVQAGYCVEGEIFFPSIRMEHSPYLAQNVIDGYMRPWKGFHGWVSDGLCPKGEEIRLAWETPAKMSEVHLYFDPDLSMELPSSYCARWDEHHHLALRQGMPSMLVRNYSIIAHKGGKAYRVVDVQDNIQRKRVHHFAPIEADSLTLHIMATWGGDAVVYQIAVK